MEGATFSSSGFLGPVGRGGSGGAGAMRTAAGFARRGRRNGRTRKGQAKRDRGTFIAQIKEIDKADGIASGKSVLFGEIN